MTRRKAFQSATPKSVARTTGDSTRDRIDSGILTLDEAAESLNTPPRAVRRLPDSRSIAPGNVSRHRRRDIRIKFFTIGEVAERLCVSRRSVRRWIDAGDLIAHRIGGIVRIAESDFRAFLAVHREG